MIKIYLFRLTESPIYSSSSQGSGAYKPRTKAAMKGYENFKVSIPTTGIDLQQALDRSPNPAGCKLAALADIALGNDVPHAVGLNPSVSSTVEPSKTGLESSVSEPVPAPVEAREPAERTITPPSTPARKVATSRTPLFTPKSASTTPNGGRKKTIPTGNKLGFNQRKKKIVPKAAATLAVVKDVYDFDDSHDSVTESIVPLVSSQNRTVPTPNKEVVEPLLDPPDDSQLSSFSDRDDYNFEDSLSDSDEDSRASSAVTKRSSTSINNIQKKSLIMGRIFKSVKKVEQVLPKDVVISGVPKEVKKKIPKQELDKMFDSLRSADPKEQATKATVETLKPEAVTNTTSPKSSTPSSTSKEDDSVRSQSGGRRSRKPREIANLEAEWGMSMDTIIDLMGVGQRKTQRRCAANKQKTFAETWSSDEYEEFHSTKDIIALIQEVEQKASKSVRLAKRNEDGNSSTQITLPATKTKEPPTSKSDDSKKTIKVVDKENVATKPFKQMNKEHDTAAVTSNDMVAAASGDAAAKAKKMTSFLGLDDTGVASDTSVRSKPDRSTTPKRGKIKNRRSTIAFKECEPPARDCSSGGRKQLPKKKLHNHHQERRGSVGSVSTQPRSKAQPKAMTRRKRIASEMLYYWSSSEDEEFGRIKPRENFDDDNLEQHGWIVGDSHKKLVTLLAHAKGKKIEDCGVKEAIHKKKS